MGEAATQGRAGVHHRGDDTRCRLVETAIRFFAAHGYDGASTRMIAEGAGVNLPAIQYHFGSKEGLFRAVIAFIGEEMNARLAPAAERVCAGLASGPLPAEALFDLLRALLHDFVETMLAQEFPESWRLILGRAEIEDAALLEPLHHAFMQQSVRPCVALLSRLLGRDEADEAVRMRAATIFGQVNIFCKPSVRLNLGWTSMEPARVHAIQDLICEQTEAMLRAARETAR